MEGDETKDSLPWPPSLMCAVLYVTRGFKDSWTSVLYEGLRQSVRTPPLHTLPRLCPIHRCRFSSHLYVFCHTLEEFCICSMCDFGVSLQKYARGGFSLHGCSFSH